MRLIPLCGLAFLAGASLLAPPAEAQTTKFDGRWSIEVITESGNCDRAYRYSVLIENGRARYGGQEPFEVTGQVSSNGTVKGAIARGDDRAEVTGQLEDNLGVGTWFARTSSRSCQGRWNAEKRG